MNCPICKNHPLGTNEIIPNLNVYTCNNCQGNWIRFEDYWKWHEHSKSELISTEPVSLAEDEYLPILDSKQAKLCPDCTRILIKYKVRNDLDFYVDHCGSCNGVWLDKNEWQVLQRNNLHHQLYSFFTGSWQKKLRQESTRAHLDAQYRTKFGPEGYNRLKDFKAWLDENPNRSYILAFLQDDNPYTI